ncbi:hypothetical protein [Curtobacterium sp. VKM Ac-1376]|nr:hypothetical protein [Curtobacterium sp. VKM Ac-1376]
MPEHDQPRHVSAAEWQRLKREARAHAQRDAERRAAAVPRTEDTD